MPTNSDAVILSAEDFATLKERSEFADELFELTIKLKDEVDTLKAELEVRTTEIDNLKAEIVKSVEEEEQQGEEALVLADNCERLLCAIHGKDYEDAELYCLHGGKYTPSGVAASAAATFNILFPLFEN